MAEDADRTRLHGAHDSARIRRLRRRRRHSEVADHRRGIRAGAGAGRSRRPRHLDAGADAARDGYRRTEAPVHRADAARRNDLVSGLFRARRRQRPREPAHARGTRRRRVGGERSEDLDQHRATRRLDLLPRAHRTERAETSGHQLPAVLDEDARHRSAAAEDDDRRRDVQRSVLHRRARAERTDRRPPRRRLAGGELDSAPRAQFARRSERDADAAERADRTDEDRNASTDAVSSTIRCIATG